MFPAAGAAVAARPAIRRAALPTNRTPFVTKNPLFWSQNFQQTPSVPRNGCFWARTPRRPCPMKGCGKGSKEEKIADQVGNDECFRSAMTSEFCGTAACRMARQAATVRALWEALGKGLPRARLLLAAAKGRRKEKQNRSPYQSLNPPTPARESAAVGRCETLLGFVDNQFD